MRMGRLYCLKRFNSTNRRDKKESSSQILKQISLPTSRIWYQRQRNRYHNRIARIVHHQQSVNRNHTVMKRIKRKFKQFQFLFRSIKIHIRLIMKGLQLSSKINTLIKSKLTEYLRKLSKSKHYWCLPVNTFKLINAIFLNKIIPNILRE